MDSKTPLTDKAVFRCDDYEGREVVDSEFARNLEIDATRWRWLRKEYAAGRMTYFGMTYFAEGVSENEAAIDADLDREMSRG